MTGTGLGLDNGLGDGGDPLLLGVFISGQESDGSVIVLRIKHLAPAHSEGVLVGVGVGEGPVKAARSVGAIVPVSQVNTEQVTGGYWLSVDLSAAIMRQYEPYNITAAGWGAPH